MLQAIKPVQQAERHLKLQLYQFLCGFVNTETTLNTIWSIVNVQLLISAAVKMSFMQFSTT